MILDRAERAEFSLASVDCVLGVAVIGGMVTGVILIVVAEAVAATPVGAICMVATADSTCEHRIKLISANGLTFKASSPGSILNSFSQKLSRIMGYR